MKSNKTKKVYKVILKFQEKLLKKFRIIPIYEIMYLLMSDYYLMFVGAKQRP